MTHPTDTSWRVGAIYRACVRYGMTKETCIEHMRAISSDPHEKSSYQRCAEIWWRHMDQDRADYKERLNENLN